jgi:hypothetical protein
MEDIARKHRPGTGGIIDCNIVGFAISIANNTDTDNCMVQSNAAVITAGGNVNSKQWIQAQKQVDA